MRVRAQLPVYSPIPPAALLGGAKAALGAAGSAATAVESWLRSTYKPRALALTDSGTSALTLALRAAIRRSPGPVLLPGFACYDLATAVDGARAEFKLYDVDPTTLAPDLESLERQARAGVAAIVVVHLYGVPVFVDPVREIARRGGALLIDDAAQGVGASLGGNPLGTLGDVGVLSFGRGKGMTGAGGGALIASTDAGAGAVQMVPRFRTRLGSAGELARACVQSLLARPSLYGIPLSLPFLGLGETTYHPPGEPRAISASALGILAGTIEESVAEAEIRRRNGERLSHELSTVPAIAPIRLTPGAVPGYLRYPALVPAATSVNAAARSLGIYRSYPLPLSELPGFGSRARSIERLPGASELARRLVTLPSHSRLTHVDLRAIVGWARRLEAGGPG